MARRRLHWCLPFQEGEARSVLEDVDVARQSQGLRSFTATNESRLQTRTDLKIRLEFLKARLEVEKSNNH